MLKQVLEAGITRIVSLQARHWEASWLTACCICLFKSHAKRFRYQLSVSHWH